jgi:hypothetical protein
MSKYDKVTVHFTSETEPMVVEQVAEIAKSYSPGSYSPAVQIIDVPLDPAMGGSLLDLTLNPADPSEIDYLVLQEEKEERIVRVRDLFDE